MRNVIPATLFTPVEQSLVADRSDLYGYSISSPIDIVPSMAGFILQENEKQSVFYLNETNRDADGDIQCWVFLPIRGDHTGRRKVIIYND